MNILATFYINTYQAFIKVISMCVLFALCYSDDDIPGIGTSNKLGRKEIKESKSTYHHDSDQADQDYHKLTPGMEKLLINPGQNRLEIFCYSGEPPRIVTLLQTVELAVKVPENNFHYFEGSNCSSIRDQYNTQSWLSFTPWRPNSFRLSVYNFSCVGIATEESFTIHLKVRYVDFWRVITLALGIGLFVMAPLLAHNVLFHYMTGVSVGVFGSLLVIVFLLSRFVPKKSGAFAVLMGGWGLILYCLQYLWTSSLILLKEYQTVVAGYVVLSGLISFALVYRWGPISDPRSLRLVQWTLQLAALALIFFSSQCQEFTFAMILILLINYNIPRSWKLRIKTAWLRRFPPKRKLLSEDEYLEESRIETKKALDELRGYCHSPNCNAWKTVSILKSPQRFAEKCALPSGQNSLKHTKRFAEFVEGGYHVDDDEILSYDSFSFSDRLRQTEDDLLTSDEEQEIENAT